MFCAQKVTRSNHSVNYYSRLPQNLPLTQRTDLSPLASRDSGEQSGAAFTS